MEEQVLIEISNKIRNIRRAKNMTLQEVADKIDITKGMISQIENGRTVPSLIVLLQIIRALEIDLNEFFHDLRMNGGIQSILVKRKEEYLSFEKEHSKGYRYQRVFTKGFTKTLVDFVILTLEPEASREFVSTEAFEYKYVVNGTVEYRFKDQTLTLFEGDSLFFDGRIEHTPTNPTREPVIMIAIYFFDEKS